MSVASHYELPGVLLRAFTEAAYAEQFIAGEIRFVERFVYRKDEDLERADQSEGEGELHIPGVNGVHVNMGIVRLQPVYILCMSSPDVELARLTRKGSFVVRIDDTQRLFSAIHESLAHTTPPDGREYLLLDSGAVRYTKGQYVDDLPPDEERDRLTYLQKPAHFSPDREHRIAVRVSGSANAIPQHLWLNVGSIESYVRWAVRGRAA